MFCGVIQIYIQKIGLDIYINYEVYNKNLNHYLFLWFNVIITFRRLHFCSQSKIFCFDKENVRE